MPLLYVLISILILLFLMIVLRFNALLALIIASISVGLMEGMELNAILASIQTGIGSTLGGLALVLGFGAMLGKIVEESGAAQRITYGLIRWFGVQNIQWAVMLTGFIVGIPMFYNAGFVILIPLVFSIAHSLKISKIFVGIPMAASLSVTHGFLPPHPGPTSIAEIYKADLGLTLIYGLILSIPIIIVAGPVLTKFLKNMKSVVSDDVGQKKVFQEEEMPPLSTSLIIALTPVIFMTITTLLSLFIDNESAKALIKFLGDPAIALLIAVICALYFLGIRRGKKMKDLMPQASSAIGDISLIFFIIGAGGAFKQVIIDSGVGNYITQITSGINVSPLVLAWAIAALMRVSLGSATVAAVTSAGIALPLITSSVSPELMVLATGAGSLMFSHVNDTGFWMFKEYFNLTLGQTFSSWTVMETIVSVMGLLGVLILDIWL